MGKRNVLAVLIAIIGLFLAVLAGTASAATYGCAATITTPNHAMVGKPFHLEVAGATRVDYFLNGRRARDGWISLDSSGKTATVTTTGRRIGSGLPGKLKIRARTGCGSIVAQVSVTPVYFRVAAYKEGQLITLTPDGMALNRKTPIGAACFGTATCQASASIGAVLTLVSDDGVSTLSVTSRERYWFLPITGDASTGRVTIPATGTWTVRFQNGRSMTFGPGDVAFGDGLPINWQTDGSGWYQATMPMTAPATPAPVVPATPTCSAGMVLQNGLCITPTAPVTPTGKAVYGQGKLTVTLPMEGSTVKGFSQDFTLTDQTRFFCGYDSMDGKIHLWGNAAVPATISGKTVTCNFPAGATGSMWAINGTTESWLARTPGMWTLEGLTYSGTSTLFMAANDTPATPTCPSGQTLVNGSCVTSAPVCVAPQVLQNGLCLTPAQGAANISMATYANGTLTVTLGTSTVDGSVVGVAPSVQWSNVGKVVLHNWATGKDYTTECGTTTACQNFVLTGLTSGDNLDGEILDKSGKSLGWFRDDKLGWTLTGVGMNSAGNQWVLN